MSFGDRSLERRNSVATTLKKKKRAPSVDGWALMSAMASACQANGAGVCSLGTERWRQCSWRQDSDRRLCAGSFTEVGVVLFLSAGVLGFKDPC